jgi:hypothetical protein
MNNEPSGWTIGWTSFASFMMVLGGVWWIISGIVAIANDEFFVVTPDYIFQFDATTWGWIHVIMGIVILLAGFYLFSAAVWARTVGVIIAVLWALAAFAWLPYYPVWGIMFIVVSISVIWALTVHGRDVVEADF